MSLLLAAAAFVMGVGLCIRVIAALYAIVDLWYAIGIYYPRVLRGVLAWGAVTLGLALWLRPPYRTAFATGIAAFLVFYLSLYALRHLALRPITSAAARPLPTPPGAARR